MGNRNSIAAGAPSTESAGEEVSQQQLISENAAHKLEERTQTIEQMGGIAAKDEKPYVSPTAGDDIAANVKVSAGETTWDRQMFPAVTKKTQVLANGSAVYDMDSKVANFQISVLRS